MRVTVVGAGAIGGWIAARLALAGNEVMALTSKAPLDTIEIEEGGASETAKLARFDGPADLQLLRAGVVGVQQRAAALLGVGQVQAGGAGEAAHIGVVAHELLVPPVDLRLPQLHVPVDPASRKRNRS